MTNRGNNSGFLFGLTLTELMILFVFLLALLIGKTSADAKALDKQLEDTTKALATQTESMATLAPVIGIDPDAPGFQQAIIDIAERFERLSLERDGLVARYAPITQYLSTASDGDELALDSLIAAIGQQLANSTDSAAFLRQLTDIVSTSYSADECASNLASSEEERAGLQQLLAEAGAASTDLDDELQNCRRQVSRQQIKLNGNNGNDKVPCWVDERGKTAYLFTVTMKADGYDVVPAWPEGYRDKALAIPGVADLADANLSPGSFTRSAKQIFDWSEARECRHYVRVSDAVGSNKDLYKRRLERVENSFYKLLLRN